MAKQSGGTVTEKEKERKARRQRKNRITIGVIGGGVIAVLVVVYLAVFSGAPPKGPDGLVAAGAAAPAFSLPKLGGGGSVSLQELKGRVVVLNFWNSQ
jgi:hypothetical protein